MASLTLRKIEKVYDNSIHAVKGIDLHIENNAFCVIVGPSGCGKTTLLMLLAGLEPLTGGEIFIDDKCVNKVEPKDRNVAVVFQNYTLYPHLSVYNNLAFVLKLRRVKKPEIQAKINRVAKLLDIDDLLKRKPHQLSGGQKQRIAIGKAIVKEPQVFLMDEPLSNLDISLRNRMREELKKLHADLRATIIYVTHDQIEAMTLATQIVVIKSGEIQQVGTPFEVFTKPANMFVAGFIGSPQMNFVALKVTDSTLLGVSIEIAGYTDCNLIAGIRPEDFAMSDKTGIRLEVLFVEMGGAEVIVHGQYVSPDEAFKLLLRFPTGEDILKAKEIRVRPKIEKVHLFDKNTGIRVDTQLKEKK